MARAVAALATNGRLVTPIITRGGVTTFNEIGLLPGNFKVVKEGMRMVVTQGTGQALNTDSVAVAAKTGTAQSGQNNALLTSWVIGFFPYDHPRYSFAVIMEQSPRQSLGEATDVMRQLLDWMIIYTPEYLR